MALTDDRTVNSNLPLPHKDNLLDDDVERLRSAFTALDADLQEEVQTLTANQTVVDLLELTSAAGCQVYVMGARLHKGQFARDPAIATRLTLIGVTVAEGNHIAITRPAQAI